MLRRKSAAGCHEVEQQEARGLFDWTKGTIWTRFCFDGVDDGCDAPAVGRLDEVYLIDAAMSAIAFAVEIIGSPESSEAAGDAEFRIPDALEDL